MKPRLAWGNIYAGRWLGRTRSVGALIKRITFS
jgi:hypothetical protein